MAAKKKTKKVGRKPSAALRRPKKAAPRRAAKKTAKRKVARRAPARRQPEGLRLQSAGPSFTVNDILKSLAFYRDVLGFSLKERWEHGGQLRGVEMLAGRVRFWLAQDDWQKGRDRVKGQGFRIYCGTSQDVDALAARIKARGGTLAQEPKDQPWGGRDLAVVDPDGFAITIASGM
jgi:uncharacterized glyoxalase superfamily protein PhnB